MLKHVSIGVGGIAKAKRYCDAAFLVDPDGYRLEAYCGAQA
jgi:hypothetical protein